MTLCFLFPVAFDKYGPHPGPPHHPLRVINVRHSYISVQRVFMSKSLNGAIPGQPAQSLYDGILQMVIAVIFPSLFIRCRRLFVMIPFASKFYFQLPPGGVSGFFFRVLFFLSVIVIRLGGWLFTPSEDPKPKNPCQPCNRSLPCCPFYSTMTLRPTLHAGDRPRIPYNETLGSS